MVGKPCLRARIEYKVRQLIRGEGMLYARYPPRFAPARRGAPVPFVRPGITHASGFEYGLPLPGDHVSEHECEQCSPKRRTRIPSMAARGRNQGFQALAFLGLRSPLDSEAAHPPCAVLHPPACRELLGAAPAWTDPRAHRATRVAPDLIERRIDKTSAMRGSGRAGRL